jgi:hypothetical protein
VLPHARPIAAATILYLALPLAAWNLRMELRSADSGSRHVLGVGTWKARAASASHARRGEVRFLGLRVEDVDERSGSAFWPAGAALPERPERVPRTLEPAARWLPLLPLDPPGGYGSSPFDAAGRFQRSPGSLAL